MEIKDLLIEGDLTQKEIAEIYQIATSSPISAMKRGVTYSDIITEDDRLKMKKTKKKISKPAPIRKTQPKIKKVKPEREKMKPKIKKVVVPKVKKTKPKSPKVLKPKKIETEITKRTNDLSENEILEIKRLLLENQHSQNRIAQMFGVHAMIISRIKNGQIHSNIN